MEYGMKQHLKPKQITTTFPDVSSPRHDPSQVPVRMFPSDAERKSTRRKEYFSMYFLADRLM